MVRAIVALALLGTVAQAEPNHLLGTRIAYGLFDIDGEERLTTSLALSIDRPLFGQWRVLGEYEYLWIGPVDDGVDEGVAGLPDSGQRVNAGIRRRVAERYWDDGEFGVFFDAEVGGGVMLVDHRPSGAIAMPHAFVGARAGFSFVVDDTRWDYEVVFRGLVMDDHPARPGVLFGIGFVWGD